MNIKKIIARTMPEAMKKVKDELGAEAVILHSKVTYSGGFLGLFKKKNVEVIAALDEHAINSVPVVKKKVRKTQNDHNKFIKSKPENEKVNESIISELEELKKVVTRTNFQQYPPIIQNSLENLKENDVGHALIGKIGEKLLDKWRITYSDSEPEQMSNWTKAALVDELSSF